MMEVCKYREYWLGENEVNAVDLISIPQVLNK